MMDSNGGGMYPNNGVPFAYGLALAMNRDVSDNRSKLTEAEKEKLIAEKCGNKSEAEKDEFINSLE